ncbi:MAG: GMC family oxidoreductase [Rhodocyclaceae bacterium]|nr:GMC family oxidoreductase [Rhodocyclaceae bacterium]
MAPRRRQVFDVCVVGTGAGGGVMIDELTRAGMSVVALERGPRLGHADFMGHDELSNVIRGTGFAPKLRETLRRDETETAQPRRFSMIGQCVGGSNVHWGAMSWRLRPDEFRALSQDGPIAGASLADWPVDAAEMAPWYDKAEAAYGVAGGAVHNAPRPGRRYPNPPHPPRSGSQVFDRAVRKLGYAPFPIPIAVNSRPYRNRAGCTNSGMCVMFGCPVDAKASPISVGLPRALATGRLDLRPQSLVHELAIDDTGRIRAARYLDARGDQHEVRARQFVLAGGSLGSAHLLLMSRSGRFRDGLANGSGLVGRNLMYHVLPAVYYLHETVTRGWLGPISGQAIDDLHASDPARGFVRGAVVTEAYPATPIVYATSAGGLWGAALKDYLRQFNRVHALIGIGEDLPVHGNRVDLDPTHTDASGLPVWRITHAHHANDLKLKAYYEGKMTEIAAAAGAERSWVVDMTQGSTGHFMGTCRMGADPEKSVLDRWCRSHEVDNLWVVDGGCFPTSGGYNPTLTIVANAYRVADHFAREARRLNLR